MREFLEKAVMTTIGVAEISRKKAEELVAEMKEKYEMSEEEGRHLIDRIQVIAKENREKVKEMAEAEVQKVVDRLGLVTREEYDLLVKRVEELEKRLNG